MGAHGGLVPKCEVHFGPQPQVQMCAWHSIQLYIQEVGIWIFVPLRGGPCFVFVLFVFVVFVFFVIVATALAAEALRCLPH